MNRSKKSQQILSVSSFALLLLFFFTACAFSQTAETTDPENGQEPVQYVLEDIKGTVQVMEVGAKEWENAEEGQVVETGDEVKVGNKSEATMVLGSDTSVHLDSGTDMKVTQIAPNETGGFLSRLEVLTGDLLADVKKHLQDSQSSFEVESNGVICGVRGTAFEVSAQGDTAEVATHEGSVAVGNGKDTHMVEAGHFSSFQRGRFQMQRMLGRAEMQRFQRWRAFRQVVFKKRMQRIQAIRAHRIKPWKRHHPLLKRAFLKKQFNKKRPVRR